MNISNKTLKANVAKTASAPRFWLLIGAVALLLIVVFLRVSTTDLMVNGKTYTLEEAKTPEQQTRGLSGRASMPADRGMLFIFSRPAVQCFWMKGMEFNLDIIWLSSSKQILDITPNISPSTYPRTICPAVQAMYVIELNAGQAQQSGMTVGETVKF